MYEINDRSFAASRTGMAVAIAFLLSAGPVLAQQFPTEPQGGGGEYQELMQEFQETQQRLGQLQDQALQSSPTLQEQQNAIGDQVNQAMIEANPNVEGHMDRLAELEVEAMAAQQAEDGEALEALVTEAQGIQMELQEAQGAALENPELQAQIQGFQDAMMQEMVSIDPEAGALIDRLEELATMLSAGSPPGL